MTYALGPLTADDRQRILDVAVSTPDLHSRLERALYSDDFPVNWAINQSREGYLFRLSGLMKHEVWDMPYLFAWKERLYRINREGQSGHRVYFFDEETLPIGHELCLLKDEVTAAFKVHGVFGDGPLNERGVAVWEIKPEFVAKKHST
jgi:hypothetical protein